MNSNNRKRETAFLTEANDPFDLLPLGGETDPQNQLGMKGARTRKYLEIPAHTTSYRNITSPPPPGGGPHTPHTPDTLIF